MSSYLTVTGFSPRSLCTKPNPDPNRRFLMSTQMVLPMWHVRRRCLLLSCPPPPATHLPVTAAQGDMAICTPPLALCTLCVRPSMWRPVALPRRSYWCGTSAFLGWATRARYQARGWPWAGYEGCGLCLRRKCDDHCLVQGPHIAGGRACIARLQAPAVSTEPSRG